NKFSDLYTQFDDLLKDMKKIELDPNTLLELLKQGFFWISILGTTKGRKHVNLHLQQIVNTLDSIIFRKIQQKKDQEGIDRGQFNLIMPLLFDPQDVKGPNSDIRKEVLLNVFNKIITTISYIEALQDLIEDSDFKANDYEGSQNNISESDNYTSDKDLNMSAQ
ncbi:17700_t:CDS:2, partial [Gigaspora margarita]